MNVKQPKTIRRFVTGDGTCIYKGENVAAGVPCIPHISNVTASNSGWAANWTIPHGCRAFEIKLRAEQDLRVSTEATGTTYFTIRADADYVESLHVPELYGYEEGTTFYFQTETNEQVVEILYWLDGTECHTPS